MLLDHCCFQGGHMWLKFLFLVCTIFISYGVSLFSCPTCVGQLKIDAPPFFIDKQYAPDSELYDSGNAFEINQNTSADQSDEQPARSENKENK